MKRPSTQDAWDAAQVIGSFWRALAEDDDVLSLQATTEQIHDELGTEVGFAGRLREALGVDRVTAARIGVSSKVRVVARTMVFPCVDVGEGHESRLLGSWGPVKVHAWTLWTAFARGGWRVAGVYQAPDGEWPEGTEYLDLPTAPPTTSPVQ